jgi:hypothetical protein
MPADPKELPVPLAEISQGPNAFEAFLDRNQKNLVALAVLLALATAAFVVYRGIETGRQTAAGEALSQAEDLASLQAVINGHAGTKAADSAVVLLAERQWTENQQDAAIATLRSFIAANPKHPAHPSAQASLGAKLMAQGKTGDAASIFQALADDPQARYIAPYALISLGDIAKIQGDLQKAETSYNRVKADFSESVFVETATRRISTLKAKAPVEIEAPPTPPTPSAPGVSRPPGSAPARPVQITPSPATAPQKTVPKSSSPNPSGPSPTNP